MTAPRALADRDGRAYRLRSIVPADALALQRAFAQMDQTDRYTRLFAPTRALTDDVALAFCTLDPTTDTCLVLVADDAPDELLGGCRLMGGDDGSEAEFSVSLRSDMKGRGLGRRLMEVLLVEAEARSFTKVWGSILAQNAAMLTLCRDLGFELRRDPDDPAVVEATWTPPGSTT